MFRLGGSGGGRRFRAGAERLAQRALDELRGWGLSTNGDAPD